MDSSISDHPERVYIRAEKFIESQLQAFNKTGHFIEHLTIVPADGCPANLQDVMSLIALLQNRCGAKVECVVMISRAVAFQAKWHHAGVEFSAPGADLCAQVGGQPAAGNSWNLDFLKSSNSPADSVLGRPGSLFVLRNY